MIHMFENPDPKLPIHIITSSVLRRIVVYPLWRLHSSQRMHSFTWPVHKKYPTTTCCNFCPRIFCSLYDFYGSLFNRKTKCSQN